MDPILDAIAKLLLAFKEPATIALLFMAIAEGAAIFYFAKWHLDRLDKDMENRSKLSTVLEGILKTLERLETLERNNGKA